MSPAPTSPPPHPPLSPPMSRDEHLGQPAQHTTPGGGRALPVLHVPEAGRTADAHPQPPLPPAHVDCDWDWAIAAPTPAALSPHALVQSKNSKSKPPAARCGGAAGRPAGRCGGRLPRRLCKVDPELQPDPAAVPGVQGAGGEGRGRPGPGRGGAGRGGAGRRRAPLQAAARAPASRVGPAFLVAVRLGASQMGGGGHGGVAGMANAPVKHRLAPVHPILGRVPEALPGRRGPAAGRALQVAQPAVAAGRQPGRLPGAAGRRGSRRGGARAGRRSAGRKGAA